MYPQKWNKLNLYYHPIFLEHLPGIRHPENPGRLELIRDYLNEKGVWDLIQVKTPQPTELNWIETNHSADYIHSVNLACEKAPQILDGGDTIVTSKSYQAALHAAGACISGIDDLINDGATAVFCAVRPPGHHAEYAHAMGFCLFNNVAIAAKYALEKYHLNRIFILDWDVHHGNGTQNSFEHTEQVFFCSIHQANLYPGTGFSSEIGKGTGKGFTQNYPLPSGSGDEDYLTLMRDRIVPALNSYKPELLIISAGFDAHDEDPLASMRLSTDCYSEMTRILLEAMRPHNNGKILSVLEGGYHLGHLAESVFAHLQALIAE